MRALKGREVIRILERAGFVQVRSSGSHFIMQRPGDKTTTVSVPLHGGKDIKTGTLKSIIRRAGMSPGEFWALDE